MQPEKAAVVAQKTAVAAERASVAAVKAIIAMGKAAAAAIGKAVAAIGASLVSILPVIILGAAIIGVAVLLTGDTRRSDDEMTDVQIIQELIQQLGLTDDIIPEKRHVDIWDDLF